MDAMIMCVQDAFLSNTEGKSVFLMFIDFVNIEINFASVCGPCCVWCCDSHVGEESVPDTAECRVDTL